MIRLHLIPALALFTTAVLTSPSSYSQMKEPYSSEEALLTADTTNVLLQKWTGPYGGVPAFDEMRIADIKPALTRGMALSLA